MKSSDETIEFTDFIKELSEDAISVKNCKLCASKHRKHAEEMAERGQSSMNIFRWLEEQGEDIKYGAVNHHINEHLKPQQANMSIKSLATRMEQWSRIDNSDEALLRRYVTLLDMEYMNLAAQNSSLPLFEQRKNIDIMLRIAQVIASYKDQLHKLQEDQRPVEIFYASLQRIISIKIKNSSPETKRLLHDILNELERAVGDVSTDGAKLLEME